MVIKMSIFKLSDERHLSLILPQIIIFVCQLRQHKSELPWKIMEQQKLCLLRHSYNNFIITFSLQPRQCLHVVRLFILVFLLYTGTLLLRTVPLAGRIQRGKKWSLLAMINDKYLIGVITSHRNSYSRFPLCPINYVKMPGLHYFRLRKRRVEVKGLDLVDQLPLPGGALTCNWSHKPKSILYPTETNI